MQNNFNKKPQVNYSNRYVVSFRNEGVDYDNNGEQQFKDTAMLTEEVNKIMGQSQEEWADGPNLKGQMEGKEEDEQLSKMDQEQNYGKRIGLQ